MGYVLENINEALRLERQSQSPLYDPIHELDDLEFKAGLNVLDAGCGSGFVARAIAERFPDLYVSGIDASEARIAEARRLVENNSKIEFGTANLREPLTRRFDRIICRFVVEHMGDADQMTVIKNLANSLTPDGRLRLIDIDGGMLNIFPRTPILEECLAIFESKRAIDFFVGRKLPKLLVDAGLQNVTWGIQTMTMNERSALNEEIKLITERFQHTLPTMAQLLGSHAKARDFQQEYLEVLQRPGTTLFYNKFIATGRKAQLKERTKLKAVSSASS